MNWKKILRVIFGSIILALVFMTVPVGHVAAVPLVDPIQTDAGLISGTMIDAVKVGWLDFMMREHTPENFLGTVGEPVRIYRGIPYAAPPVGDFRWKPPQPVTPWENIRECTTFSKMAPQYPFPQSFFYGAIPESGMSEDCLYLNVVTPAQDTDDGLPVIVFFHGGGLTSGSTSYDNYNNPFMAQHGVVWVTVQHRLNALGYMAHPELTAESVNNASGNYGQLDLMAALQWVQTNIAKFGGDPDRVMIIGQSGGGMKVNGLMASPLAAGLFQRAVCQSGFGTSATPLATAEQYGLNLQAKLGAASLAEMRAMTWQEIVTAAAASDSGYVSNHTVDGWVMTDTIRNIFEAGEQNDVPYMASFTGAEASYFMSTPAMANLLLTMTQNQQSPIYVYVFTHVPEGWKDLGVYSWHGADVAYGFGDYESLNRFLAALLPATLPFDPGVTAKDPWVCEYLMTMEAQFAATGNPSMPFYGPLGAYWPAYDERDQYLDIGFYPRAKGGFSTLTENQPPRDW